MNGAVSVIVLAEALPSTMVKTLTPFLGIMVGLKFLVKDAVAMVKFALAGVGELP